MKLRIVSEMIFAASLISDSVIISGGANLIVSPCVFFANKPFSFSFKHTFQASISERFCKFIWKMQKTYWKILTLWGN